MTLPRKFKQILVNFSHRWRVRDRLILSGLFALISSFLLPTWSSLSTRILFIWDAGMFCFLVLTWILMLQAVPKTMRRNAQSQEVGRLVILGLIIAAACASILAIADLPAGSDAIVEVTGLVGTLAISSFVTV